MSERRRRSFDSCQLSSGRHRMVVDGPADLEPRVTGFADYTAIADLTIRAADERDRFGKSQAVGTVRGRLAD